MAVAYSFDSLASNSMKSKNPHSGCRRVEIAKTLDTTDPNPSKNQGGIAIVEPVPYTLKIRSGCEGGGKGALIQEDKSATLATNNDQYLFQPMNMVLDDQGEQQITVRTDGKAPTLRAETHGNLPCVLEAAGFKAGQSMAGGIGWQIKSVIRELRRDPNSRRAIIEVRRTSDAYLDDPPCLQNIQLLIREGRLNMTALFRSNDACKATFMNAYALTCLQEKVAAELGVNVGSYTHIANSFHAYERDWKLLESYSERLMSGGELTYNFRGEWDELMEVERDDILREV